MLRRPGEAAWPCSAGSAHWQAPRRGWADLPARSVPSVGGLGAGGAASSARAKEASPAALGALAAPAAGGRMLRSTYLAGGTGLPGHSGQSCLELARALSVKRGCEAGLAHAPVPPLGAGARALPGCQPPGLGRAAGQWP
jgi:hypothetical protein